MLPREHRSEWRAAHPLELRKAAENWSRGTGSERPDTGAERPSRPSADHLLKPHQRCERVRLSGSHSWRMRSKNHRRAEGQRNRSDGAMDPHHGQYVRGGQEEVQQWESAAICDTGWRFFPGYLKWKNRQKTSKQELQILFTNPGDLFLKILKEMTESSESSDWRIKFVVPNADFEAG